MQFSRARRLSSERMTYHGACFVLVAGTDVLMVVMGIFLVATLVLPESD